MEKPMNVSDSDFIEELCVRFQNDKQDRARLHQLIDAIPMGTPVILIAQTAEEEVLYESWNVPTALRGERMLISVQQQIWQ